MVILSKNNYTNSNVKSSAVLVVIAMDSLLQIIDLRDTDKSRYFAITEFNNCLNFKSLFESSGKIFEIFIQERFQLHMSRILFETKHI